MIVYTNKGPVRDHNEDAVFALGNVISGCSMAKPLALDVENPNGCCVVIDGMGGYKGGERAARIVAQSFLDSAEAWNVKANEVCYPYVIDVVGPPLLSLRDMLTRHNCIITAHEACGKIFDILIDAAKRISDAAAKNPELSSMGAVLAGVVFCLDAALVFNCGDCRVYRHNGECLEKLSHDHSIVQELCDLGKIDEYSMRTHPRKNIVTSCVSANLANSSLFLYQVPLLQEGQKFFMCSDGVWEALSDKDIEECLSMESTYEAACTLSKKLLELGDRCHDNISFLIV